MAPFLPAECYDVKYPDYNFDYVNLHRLSLSMNLLNLAASRNYFMAAYLIRNRKYLPPDRPGSADSLNTRH